MDNNMLLVGCFIVDEIYHACIRNNWYTCGTSEEYEQMFNVARSGIGKCSQDAVIRDIYLHSDEDVEHRDVYNTISAIYKEARDMASGRNESNEDLQYMLAECYTGEYAEQLALEF